MTVRKWKPRNVRKRFACARLVAPEVIELEIHPLQRGLKVLIDRSDLDLVLGHEWILSTSSYSRSVVTIIRRGRRKRTVHLRRHLLGLERGDPRKVCHADSNFLDHRRGNLKLIDRRNSCQ